MQQDNDFIWKLVGVFAICFLAGPLILGALVVTLTMIVPILIAGAILWAVCIGVGSWLSDNGHIDLNK